MNSDEVALRDSEVAAPVAPTLNDVATVQPSELARAIIDMAKALRPDQVPVLQALVDMQQRMEEREARRQFLTAFQALQHELPIIKRNGTLEYPINKNDPDGPKRKISSFARWEDIQAEIEPLLWQHGFTLTFDNEQTANSTLVVTAVLSHVGGHSQRAKSPPLPCDSSGGKNNLQGWGSSGSYGCRYATRAVLNLKFEGEDDDGASGGRQHITPDQAAELVRLIKETQTDEARLLQVMTADARSVEEIEQRDYVRVRNALLAKRTRLQGQTDGEVPSAR